MTKNKYDLFCKIFLDSNSFITIQNWLVSGLDYVNKLVQLCPGTEIFVCPALKF